MTRSKLIFAAVALLIAFLAGWVPQYRTTVGLREDLNGAQQQLAALQHKAEVAELRDLIALTWMDVNARNYGVARQTASRFFTRAQEISTSTGNEQLRSLLASVSVQRDSITAGLADPQGEAQPAIEQIARQLYELTP
jgi:hypothetical protein